MQEETLSEKPELSERDPQLAEVLAAIEGSQKYLFSQQHADGYWCGELEADSMLEADYIYLHALYDTGDPGRMKRALAEKRRHTLAVAG